MAADKRILERVNKLLRLAGPSSGTTEAERVSAALAAADLVEKHNLTVIEAEPVSRASMRAPQKRAPSSSSAYAPIRRRPSPPQFRMSIAARSGVCMECDEPIEENSKVWFRLRNLQPEYIHADGRCGWD